MNLKLSDKLLLILGLALTLMPIAIWNSPQLMNRFIRPKTTNINAAIGTVKQTLNDTRRRHSGSLSWYSLSEQEILFENDTVFSGDNSNVELQLDKTDSPLKLNLSANTLLTLSLDNGMSKINLEMGSISSNLSKGQSLHLNVDGIDTILESNSDSSQVQILNSGKQTIFSTENGQFNIRTGDQSEVLDKQKLIELNGDNIKSKEIKFKSMSPNLQKPIFLGNEDPIPFNWTNDLQSINEEALIVEISNYSDFKHPFVSANKKEGILGKELTKSGTYYWRVKDKENGQSKSIPFMVIKKEELSLLTPANETLIESDEKNEAVVSFNWRTPNKSQNFEISIAKSEDFREILTQKNLSKMNTYEQTLPDGLYYWKVASEIVGINESLTSNTFKFAVGKATSFQAYMDELQAKLNPPVTQELPIIKKAIKPPEKINIYKNSNLELLPIKDILKKVNPTNNNTATSVKLKWNKSLDSSDVQIQIAKDPHFKAPVVKKSKDRNTTITLVEPGTYYVKANYLNKNGKVVAEPNSSIEFNYEIQYAVKSPTLLQPSNNLKLVAFGQENVSIYFEWQSIPYADRYLFQTSANPDFSRILSEQFTVKANYYLNEKMLQNQLYWRVKAFHKKLESKWSKYRTIYLNSSGEN